MKKTSLLTIAFLAFHLFVSSQKEFQNIYNLKIPVSADYWSSSSDRTGVVAGDLAEICSIDAIAGKVRWTMNFKEKLGTKKCENWNYLSDIGIVEVQCKGDKKGDYINHYFDDKTGEKVSEEAFQSRKQNKKKSKTTRQKGSAWSFKDALDLENPDVHLSLNYERPKYNSSFQGKKKYDITINCTGAFNWKTTVQGNFVRSLCDNNVGYDAGFGGDFISINVSNNIVFVQYEGLSAIDLTTGKLLWETTFDYSYFDFGMFKSEMIIGRAPMPVVSQDAAYIADLSSDSRKIKKLELTTGRILWESEKLSKDAIISEMAIVNSMLIVRNGGLVNVQTLTTSQNGSTLCRSEYKEEGKFSLTAYDAQTGVLKWNAEDVKALSDKFKSITNLITDEKNIYVASEKNIFCLNATDGSPIWKTELSKLKVGKPTKIIEWDDDIMIDTEEGVCRVVRSNGQSKFATNTGLNLGWMEHGGVYYLWTGKKPEERNEFIRINLETGVVEGKIKDTAYPYFSEDGNEFLKKDGQVLSRFKTN